MTDIVEKLRMRSALSRDRGWHVGRHEDADTDDEAADKIERLRAEIQQLKQDSTIFIIERGDAISQNADLREENTELRGEIAALRGLICELRLIKADWRAAMTENHDLWRENEQLGAEIEQLKNQISHIIEHNNPQIENANSYFKSLEEELARCNKIIDDYEEEHSKLREALEKLIAACDAGRRYEKGIGGMTIAAQLARTVIYGVSASAVEDARDALAGEKGDD